MEDPLVQLFLQAVRRERGDVDPQHHLLVRVRQGTASAHDRRPVNVPAGRPMP